MKAIHNLFYPIMVRVKNLPGIRQTANLLYKAFRSEKKLDMDINAARRLLSDLPSRPTGHAYWDENDRPVWSESKYDLTVIIPFYNAEQYAETCIQSVLEQQTTYSFEVIMVDDGSPDRCGEIIDRYKDYSNVRVVHQKNGGVSAARNTGIRLAQGNYVMFVDSDDWLCAGAIHALLSAAEQHGAYIVDGSFTTTTVDGKPKRHYGHGNEVGSYGEGMYGYAWGKIFKKEIFATLCFPKGFWSEDTICPHLLFLKAPVTATISDCVFMYRTNPKGISESCATNPKCIDKLYVVEEVLNSYQHVGLDMQSRKTSIIWELGPSVYGRIHGLEEKYLEAAFIYAANLVEKYQLIPSTPAGSFYEQELWDAFRNRQYYKWKWASFLM